MLLCNYSFIIEILCYGIFIIKNDMTSTSKHPFPIFLNGCFWWQFQMTPKTISLTNIQLCITTPYLLTESIAPMSNYVLFICTLHAWEHRMFVVYWIFVYVYCACVCVSIWVDESRKCSIKSQREFKPKAKIRFT